MKAAKRNVKGRPAAAGAPARQPFMPWTKWAATLAALAAALAVYWPAVHGPFLFDDEYLPFQDPGFLDLGLRQIMATQRPLMNAGFWLNLKLFGPDPFSYHLINILLHTLNALLCFLIVRRLLEHSSMKTPQAELLAAFAAAVFLLHPVQTESVAYVAGRSENFSLVFFLGSFAVFVHKPEGPISWGRSAAVIALFAAAFLSKEHTAVLPALLLWTDIWFARQGAWRAVKSNWRLYLPLAASALIGASLVWKVLAAADTAGFSMKDLPWHHYFYTQWRAWWVYLRLFLFPANLNADYAFPFSRTPFEHGAVVGLAAMAGLFVLAWRFRGRYPLAFFGLVSFALLLAPTSSVIPIRDAVAERRIYLPFLGLLLVVCDLLRSWEASRHVQLAAMGSVLALLSGLTHSRSAVWSDPELLWQDTIQKSPGNSRAHFQLAMVYYQQNRCLEALRKFEDAARTGPTDHRLLVDWGLAHDCAGQADQALEKLRQAAALENTGHVRSLIGMVLAKQSRLQEALDELNQAARLQPDYDMLYVYRGNVYLMQQEVEKAEADYRRALELNPANAAAQQGLAATIQRKGKLR